MKKFNWWIVTTFLASAIAIVATAREQARHNAPVRPEVVATLKRWFPDLAITQAYETREDGEGILRIRLKDGTGKQDVLAKVSMDGDILDLDDDKELGEVPPNIVQALRKGFPHAEITHAEKGTRLEISYRFDIVENGSKHEVKITRRGRIFEVVSRD